MWAFEDRGELVWLHTRADIMTLDIQQRIADAVAAKPRRSFLCRCSPKKLRLFPVETASRRGTLRCGAHENTEHADGCFARLGFEAGNSAIRRQKSVYAASILLAPTEPEPFERNPVTLAKARTLQASDERYEDLMHLSHAKLQESMVAAFRGVNRPPLRFADIGLRNPSRTEIYCELFSRLGGPIFTNGQSVFQAAAKAKLRAYWGVTFTPLVAEMAHFEIGDGVLHFSTRDHWSENGPVGRAQEFQIGRLTARAVGGKLTEFGRLIGPPYFFLLTATATNQVARIELIPVASCSSALFGIESEVERKLVDALFAAGIAMLKPLPTLADFAMLGDRLWPGPTIDGGGYLPRRPDLLIFSGGLIVAQLMGSDKDGYVDDVDAAIEELRAHFTNLGVGFLKITLDDLHPSAMPKLLAEIKGGASRFQGRHGAHLNLRCSR